MLKVYSLFSAVPNTSSDPTGQWKLNHCANEVTFVVTVELSYALWQLLHIALTDYTEGKENHLRPTRETPVALFYLAGFPSFLSKTAQDEAVFWLATWLGGNIGP